MVIKIISLSVLFLFLYSSSDIIWAQNTLNTHFEEVENIKLDENSGDFLTAPTFNSDKQGNFIVTDFGRHHVQIFNKEGEFLGKYGRFGQGPGDFERPVQTIRLRNDNLLTIEANGKLSKFSPTGNELVEVYNSSVIPATQLVELETGEILLGGRKLIDGKTYFLHLFDLESGKIVHSFLDADFQYENYKGPMSMIMDMVLTDVHGDKITAALAPFSKLYHYDLKGNLLNKVELSLENFQDIEQSNRPLKPQERMALFDQFSMFSSISWINENEIFLQFFKKDEADLQKNETTRYLALIDTDGTIKFEHELDEKIVAVNKYSGYLIQASPEEPSRLRVWEY